MASILKGCAVALALIFLIVVSSSFEAVTMAEARIPYKQARQLATDCNSPRQGEIAGCGGGKGSGGSSRPSGPTPGSSRCRKGCCSTNKLGECVCCI
ncbi:hypothetical protein CTI12_AA243710 [Artemisia annua]|uniref:Uncharacterized protein n=1 Tax=Artemisia annua TaxID=35608 RepID=A0A2U1NPN8_ARTAN|nr:hypothetical protein CTI12_AA243710 [Artemisia annua]